MTDLKAVATTPQVIRYVREQAPPLTGAQLRLIERTTALGGVAEMQIPPEQGALLTLLTRLVNARTVVEVGTFTGYSTMAFAAGLAPGGRVITLDISDEWSPIATAAWTEAGVTDRITPVVGPAAGSIAAMPDEPFIDLVFLDADKTGYRAYWDLLVPRVRPGGLLLADNVLYAGEAADPGATGNARAIREFNDYVRADPRVDTVLLTVSDGLTVGRKR
jgi:caffeoyl-CoA O-methyltransferase